MVKRSQKKVHESGDASDLLRIDPNNSSEKNNSNNLFVYKVIHDLRHPVHAINDGLTALIEETKVTKRLVDKKTK